jgi:hypothetical protein
VRTPGEQASPLVAAGHARGVGLYSAAPCCLGTPTRELELVMGFAGLEPAAIRESVLELRELLRDHALGGRGARLRRHSPAEVSPRRDTLARIPGGAESARRTFKARPLHCCR